MKNSLTFLIVLIAIGSVNAKSMVEPKSPVGMAVVKSGNIFKGISKNQALIIQSLLIKG